MRGFVGILNDGKHDWLKLPAAFFFEFLINILFSLYGNGAAAMALPAATTDPVITLALANGLTLTVVVYIAANISGGHLTPSITIATWITGHTSAVRSIGYMISQLCGSILGVLLLDGLLHPTVYPGQGTGCVVSSGINHGQLFGWEFMISFVLVMTVFAVAVGEPSFGNVAPLAAGLSVVIGVLNVGVWTGGGFSPARVLGAAIVKQCNWGQVYIYCIAEMLGGVVAGLFSWPIYGTGADFLRIWDTPAAPPVDDDMTGVKMEDPTVRTREQKNSYIDDVGSGAGGGYLDGDRKVESGYIDGREVIGPDGKKVASTDGYLNKVH